MSKYSTIVQTAKTYYDSDDADKFYKSIWGGEDIHIGWYTSPQDSIINASRRTVEKIADKLNLNQKSKVLDIGSGYGGAARFLTKKFGCVVTCLNLSEVQNNRNRQLNSEQGLTKKIDVIDGSFETIPSIANNFDCVWSQDALLHSGRRNKVISEVARVLKPNGKFIFTDPMQSDDCPTGVLKPVLDRIHLDSMGSPEFYKQTCDLNGLKMILFDQQTNHLINHYTAILKEIETRYDSIVEECSPQYIEKMKKGLSHWINAGEKNYLSWGILLFIKS